MNFEQLEVALAIAEKRNFSEAAYEISLSPSSVSRQINSLEAELGVKLFHRNAKSKVVLTQDGEALLPYFRSLMRTYGQMRQELELLRGKTDTLRLLSWPSLPRLENSILLRMLKRKPQARFVEYRLPDREALEYLYSGRADVGLASLFGPLEENPVFARCAEDEQLLTYPIQVENGYVLMHRQHPLARRASLSLADLADYPEADLIFASFSEERARQYVDIVESWSRRNHKPLRCRVLNTHVGTVNEILNTYIRSHPESVTIVQDILLRNNDCVKVPFSDRNLYFTTFLYYLKNNKSEMLSCFIKCAKELVNTPHFEDFI